VFNVHMRALDGLPKELPMRKLMLSVFAVASFAAGAAFAQSGDAESQAGSAWRSNPIYGPAPGSPEHYGNSGWPPAEQQPYYDSRSRRYVPYGNRSAPAYPHFQPSRGDRDGDGVRNRRDRYPDDPRRW
jgi:hypothetical protein